MKTETTQKAPRRLPFDPRLLENTACTIGGALVMNGILQLLVYPYLHRTMGTEALGALLFIMGLVAILCPSVGQSLNTGRLVVRRDLDVTNGDYDVMVLLFGGAGSLIALAIAAVSGNLGGVWAVLPALALFMTTIFRYYGDVEYRLSLKYRGYFVYYAVLSAGYILGLGLFRLTNVWYVIFLAGEVLALVYVGFTGSIFRGFLARSRHFGEALKRETPLVFSYLITNLTLNIDRVVLEFMLGNVAVTEYYVASLIGKTMVMLVAPINTILISYLTRKNVRMNRRQFLLFSAAGGAVSLMFILLAQIGTPLFVWLFYRNLFESVRPIMTIVNIAQVLGLLSAYLFMVVLTFTEERWQLILQGVHLVLLLCLVFIFREGGIRGFSVAVLIANTLRIAAVMALGLFKVGKDK